MKKKFRIYVASKTYIVFLERLFSLPVHFFLFIKNRHRTIFSISPRETSSCVYIYIIRYYHFVFFFSLISLDIWNT